MTKVRKNELLKGWSGTFGNQIVFKNYGDKIVVSAKPKRNPNEVFSEKKKQAILKFKQASEFAKSVMANEEKKAI